MSMRTQRYRAYWISVQPYSSLHGKTCPLLVRDAGIRENPLIGLTVEGELVRAYIPDIREMRHWQFTLVHDDFGFRQFKIQERKEPRNG